MANKNYEQGRRLEYKTIKHFEDNMSCTATRAAGSHGLADVIAWDSRSFWLVQVKSGNARMTPAEIESFQDMAAPPNAIKQIYAYYKAGNKWELVIKNLKDMRTDR